MSKRLTEEDYDEGARRLGVDAATTKAVADVESAGSGFLPDGRPKILFERHHFHRLTGGRFSGAHPDISNPRPGGYAGGVAEYGRFDKAATLDEAAAIKATSWGKFQIMGFNYVIAGYESLDHFREAMQLDEREHLLAFCGFVKGSHLDDELRRKDWEGFAEGYNGRGYKKNQYDTKLAAAYKKHAGIPDEPPAEPARDSASAVAIEQGAAATDTTTVNVAEAGAVNVESSATPAPVPGGGPKDAAVKANDTSLITKIQFWAKSALKVGGTASGAVGAATAGVSALGTLSERAQLLLIYTALGLIALIVIGAVVYFIVGAVAALVDHLQTKWAKARGDLVNVK